MTRKLFVIVIGMSFFWTIVTLSPILNATFLRPLNRELDTVYDCLPSCAVDHIYRHFDSTILFFTVTGLCNKIFGLSHSNDIPFEWNSYNTFDKNPS